MKATTILGLDFGERRIGVALSDIGKTLATGLTTLDCRRDPNFLETLGVDRLFYLHRNGECSQRE